MRSFIVMAMFSASLASAAWDGYIEDRSLELDADGVRTLEIEAGAGSLEVTSSPDADVIQVDAQIRVGDADEDKVREMIESDLRLTLERDDEIAQLHAYFEHGFWGSNWNVAVDLKVEMPQGLVLMIDDGSGSIRVNAPASELLVDDGSGSISIIAAGETTIDDGSGSIDASDIVGDISIDDGSGDIRIRGVTGSVMIDDGSGSINVADVSEDLTIIDDGSGSLRLTDIRGQVTRPD